MYHAFSMLDQAFAASYSVGQENDIFCSPYLMQILLACCNFLYKCLRAWDSNKSHIWTVKEQSDSLSCQNNYEVSLVCDA